MVVVMTLGFVTGVVLKLEVTFESLTPVTETGTGID
jgi:hypothetical protein